VLIIGGSEGGLSSPLLAAALAGHGYPVLTIAYFGAPGLPASLSRIPLEYFARRCAGCAASPGSTPRLSSRWASPSAARRRC
jgi:hypothetical protein